MGAVSRSRSLCREWKWLRGKQTWRVRINCLKQVSKLCSSLCITLVKKVLCLQYAPIWGKFNEGMAKKKSIQMQKHGAAFLFQLLAIASTFLELIAVFLPVQPQKLLLRLIAGLLLFDWTFPKKNLQQFAENLKTFLLGHRKSNKPCKKRKGKEKITLNWKNLKYRHQLCYKLNQPLVCEKAPQQASIQEIFMKRENLRRMINLIIHNLFWTSSIELTFSKDFINLCQLSSITCWIEIKKNSV